jgi:hypothetical protein
MKVPSIVFRTPMKQLWKENKWTAHLRIKEISADELASELDKAGAVVTASVMFPLCWENKNQIPVDKKEILIRMVRNGEFSDQDDIRYETSTPVAFSSLWLFGENRVVLIEINH